MSKKTNVTLLRRWNEYRLGANVSKPDSNMFGLEVGNAVDEITNSRKKLRQFERQLAEAQEGLDGIDQALANAEHWMGKCEELERQIVVISAESEKLKEMVARYLVAIYDVPIRQVDCRMDTDKIDQLHDDIIDEIGQEYIDSAMKGGER